MQITVAVDGAEATTYTANEAGDWVVEPDNMAAGLDELAARMRALDDDATSDEAFIDLPITSFTLADGTPLAKFADGASPTPGFNLADSEFFNVRWNNHATPTAIARSFSPPDDFDEAAGFVVKWLASKSGATVGDAVKFTTTLFFHTVGALHDADSNAGGDSLAMTGDATAKTVQEVTLAVAHGDIPAGPWSCSISFKPKDGTLGTDDVMVGSVRVYYTKKRLPAA